MDLRRAVVVDQWALVRVGIGTTLRHLSIRVAGESAGVAEGLASARSVEADLVVLGSFVDGALGPSVTAAKGLLSNPLVVCLLPQPDRDVLAECLSAGADAVLLRSASDSDLTQAVKQIAAGQRWVTPALSLLLAGAVGETGVQSVLTAKEVQVLAGLAAGRANKALAEELFVSQATVKTHLAHIYAKLGVKGRREAVARAVELGLLA